MSLSRIMIFFKKSSLAHGRAGGKPPLSGFDAPRRDWIQLLDNLAIDPPAGRLVHSAGPLASSNVQGPSSWRSVALVAGLRTPTTRPSAGAAGRPSRDQPPKTSPRAWVRFANGARHTTSL